MYDRLVKQANGSLAGAYQVGIAIETTDIADIAESLGGERVPADVRIVLERLSEGSENHLAAFTKAADGGTRIPR